MSKFWKVIVLYNVGGSLISSEHQLYRVTPLKTSFGLLIPLSPSKSHVTTITPNYFLGSDCTQLTITYAFVTTITFRLLHVYTVYVHYTLIFTALSHIKSPNLLSASSLTDFSAIGHFHRLSHTVAHAKSLLHTAKLSPRSPRIHFLRLLLKTAT
jgi:hypothetical protein